MSAPILPGFGRVTITVTGDGDPEPMSWGWDFSNDASSTPSVLAAVVEASLLARGVTVASNYHVGWNIPSLTVDINDGGAMLQHVEPIGSVGGTSGNTCPSNVALLIRKTTGQQGRKFRGRMFLPPFSLLASNVDRLGTVNSTAMAVLIPRYHNLFLDMVAGSMRPVILHGDGSTPTLVTDFVVQGKVATQRRRLRP